MPTWFIQLFGVLLLCGFCFAAYYQESGLFLVEGVSVCLAMIFVGRHIAGRQGRGEKNNCPPDQRMQITEANNHRDGQVDGR